MLVAWVVTLYPLNMPKMDFTSMVNPYLYTVVPVVPSSPVKLLEHTPHFEILLGR